MKKNRNKCVLCGSETKEIFNINMPVFMGVNINNENESSSKMSFNCCEGCGEVQIDELLDLNLLYQNNHNISVIGNIWKEHYTNLSQFIGDVINDKTILEISDPSAKLAKLSDNFKKWYIVEPNPENIELNNVEFINGFFGDNFNTVKDVDVIIHSHLLEHIHEPFNFFKQCNNILNENGIMIISIPNMDYILDNNYSPNNILHFEHTYFINTKVLELLANSNGFKIIETKLYKNHSIFYKLQKDSSIEKSTELPKFNIYDKFKNNFITHINNIDDINNKMSDYNDYDIFLFGAHVSSQFYLYNGLNKEKIKGIIDNDVNKQNYKLYGTELNVNNPNIISNNNKCIVICSHIGIYFDEIVKQLMDLNKNLIII